MKTQSYHEEVTFIKNAIVESYNKHKNSSSYQCREKMPFDVVTSVDYKIEEDIITKIHSKYPDDRILSEETKNDTIVLGRTWTIDPIDGTYNFSNNLPLFGVQASLFEDGQPVVCAIYIPITRAMYHAASGGGAFLNEKKIVVNKVPLDKTVLSMGDFPHSRPDDIIEEQNLLIKIYPKIARIRMLGAASLDFACVASGKTNGTILYTKNKWDIAPGILLCREAGALVYGDKGEYSFDSRFVIAVSSKELLDCIFDTISGSAHANR